MIRLGGRSGAAVRLSENFDMCKDLEVLKVLYFALKQKCTLSERSEFGHFCFAFSKIQNF